MLLLQIRAYQGLDIMWLCVSRCACVCVCACAREYLLLTQVEELPSKNEEGDDAMVTTITAAIT